MHNTTILLWIILFAAGFLVGCETPVADEAAIQRSKSVVIVPFRASESDPSAGAIAAGAASATLQQDLDESVRVRIAPVIWRITQPNQQGLTDADALQLAKHLGMDTVLTGSTHLTLEHEKEGKAPKVLKAGQVPSSSIPKGDVEVKLRLLSVESGRCIYEMTGRAKGDKPARRMDAAVGKAVDPLVKLWNQGKSSWRF